MGSIKLNAAKCLTCGVIIESTHVHDFRSCNCPDTKDPKESTRIFVDGGHEYIRRGFGPKARWWELTVDDGSAGYKMLMDDFQGLALEVARK